MLCDHCGQPIRPGEKVKTYPVDSASSAAPPVTLHAKPCKRPPTQTYPSR